MLLGLGRNGSLAEGRIVAFGVLNASDDGGLCQIFGDGAGENEWGGHEGLPLQLLAVLELRGDRSTVTVISGLTASASSFSCRSLICANNLILRFAFRTAAR